MKIIILLVLTLLAGIALAQDDTTEPIRARILELGKTNLPINWTTNTRAGTIACAVHCGDEKEADALWKNFKTIDGKLRLTQVTNAVIVVVAIPDTAVGRSRAPLAAGSSPFGQAPTRPKSNPATRGLGRDELLKQAAMKRDLTRLDLEEAARLDREADRLDHRGGWHSDRYTYGHGLENQADRLQERSDAIQTTPYSRDWARVPDLEGQAFLKRNAADRLEDDAMNLRRQADDKRADAARLQREAMDLETQAGQAQR
jgi:hypothetical protein